MQQVPEFPFLEALATSLAVFDLAAEQVREILVVELHKGEYTVAVPLEPQSPFDE